MSIRINEVTRVLHNRLILALVEEYEKNGCYVKADHISHPHGKPDPVNGHIPDIVVYSNGKIIIIAEAETCDTISDISTLEQWQAFSRSSYQFHVIVPEECLEAAKRQATLWSISVNKWWYL